jgi:sterol desaturase/sphingolipid hydroxylase (fatty acid hydroxylase superfamily)
MPFRVPETSTSVDRRELVRRLGSSRFNYWFGYVANVGLVVWLASQAWRGGRGAPGAVGLVGLALGGLLFWTMAEYLLHRYVYHELPSFLSVGHGLHHASPRAHIGVPWWLTTVLVVAVFLLVQRWLDPAALGVFMAACWSGYLLYCIAHHGSHRWRFRSRWLRNMRRRHLIHHARVRYNLGFTTALWDRVFGTYLDRDFDRDLEPPLGPLSMPGPCSRAQQPHPHR